MGTVAVNDLAVNTTRFPHAMMVMNRRRESSPAESDRPHLSGTDSDSHHSRHLSQQQSTSPSDAHTHSVSDPPTESSTSAPIDVPQGHGRGARPSNTDEDESASDRERSPPRQGDAHPPRAGNDEGKEDHSDESAHDGAADRHSSPPSPQLRPTQRSSLSLNNSGSASPAKIVVRDLNHIQSFASEEMLARSARSSRRSLRGRMEGSQQYEISSMPVTDIIEMVAGLLTKITTTNDRPSQHEQLQRHLPNNDATGSATQQQIQSVLSFHGRNVPSITILSYLTRIHRYCPTTYEVFLSLLVYFDRMTEKINGGTLQSFKSIEGAFSHRPNGDAAANSLQTPPASGSVPALEEDHSPDQEHAASLVDSDDEENEAGDPEAGHVFVVDSYNIHRLVIAGVTCASKFFSDVFYTNSRYAKVGGLPIHELNHLELHFLLLNDFRLSVPVEELEAYGSRLVEFYAREVVAQQMGSSSHESNGRDDLYMGRQQSPSS